MVEVTNFDYVPCVMEILIFRAGQYTVFLHKCPANEGVKTYQYIFMCWLNASKYEVDSRRHFAVTVEMYKKEAAD